MKTLIINGSPRKNGDTVCLITELKNHLQGDIYTVNTYYDDIKPCIDCRYCWSRNKCAINDEMTMVYDLLCEIDNIVIASPLYFSQLTGSLLNFASRLQYLYVSRVIRKDGQIKLSHKKGAIILVGGGDGSPAPALQTATTLIHQMGGEVVGNICSLNTNTVSAKDDVLALLKIKELANLINGI